MLTADDVRALARDLESDRVERKRTVSPRKRLREVVCAFANDMPNHGMPGYLLLGVEDDGSWVGAEVTDATLRNLADLRDDGLILPLPQMAVYKVEVEPGIDVIVVEVQPHLQPPVRAEGRTWIRVGARQAIATVEDERVLTERRAQRFRTWDEWLCNGATVEDLRMRFIREDYVPRRIAPEILAADTRSDIDLLDTLRLWYRGIKIDGPTHGSMLLFSHRPRHFYKGLWLQFVRFSGDHRATKSIDDQEYEGDVFAQLAALEKIDEHIQTVTLPDGRTVPEYPAEAVREMVINAIMHRDFQARSPILFYWFSNRIEVLNAGGLMTEVSPEIFTRHGPGPGWHGRRTAYRNEAISEAMKSYGYVQKFGTGIPKIRNALAANGSPYAEFRWNHREFQATIYSVTQPKFETDQEKIEWLLKKEGNEEIEPLLTKVERNLHAKYQAQIAQKDVEARQHQTQAKQYQKQIAQKDSEIVQKDAEARRESLFAILDARDLSISPGVKSRIDGCSDIEQLTRWLRNAATAESGDEVVEE